jgi:neutral/alkaline ceramidase-like enzyme
VGKLLAGIARTTITPPLGTFLMGYFDRTHPSIAVHDDLVATAWVLSDGHNRVAIVTCELLMLHTSTVAAIRALVAARTGIPALNVMLCCSHTHSGPVTFCTDDAAFPARRAYLDDLVGRLVEAVVHAGRDLQPARWGVGRGKLDIGVNRRQTTADGSTILGENPAGKVDRDLLLVRFDAVGEGAQTARPLGLMVNYACHAVCLSGKSYVTSADWPGAMRREVEAAIETRVGFIQGACADINPLGGPQDTFDQAQHLGARAAGRVCDLYDGIALQREIDLSAVRRDVELPLFGPLGRDGRRVRPLVERVGQHLRLPQEEAMAMLDRRFPWRAVAGGTPWSTRAEVQAILLGDVALVGVAAEPFCEIGLQVKARSAAALTLFAGYTNGCVGYVPVPLAYEQGGYEVDASYIYYRLDAPLVPACADLLAGAALDLIDTMAPLA